MDNFLYGLYFFLAFSLFPAIVSAEFIQDDEKKLEKEISQDLNNKKQTPAFEENKTRAFEEKMDLDENVKFLGKYKIYKSFVTFSSESSVTGRRTLKYESLELGRYLSYFYPWLALGWNIGFLTESNGNLLENESDNYHGLGTHLALYLRFPLHKYRFLRLGTGLGYTNLPLNKSNFFDYGELGARFQIIFEADLLHLGLSYMRNGQQDLLGFSAGFQLP